MNYVFLKSSWVFKKFFGDEEFISNMKAAGIKPTRILNNDGSCGIIDSEGNHIATVSCQSKFKRGEGSIAECEERDANARLISNSPSMYRTLKKAVDLYTPTQMSGGEWIYPEWYRDAKCIIEQVEGEA